MKTIYDFSIKDAELRDVPLKNYKKKVLLIVNVASYCGLTYQYNGLEKLYKKYKSMDFEILGFPCNQFAMQEPGTNQEIKEFCDANYGITFKIFNKTRMSYKKLIDHPHTQRIPPDHCSDTVQSDGVNK